LHLASEKGHINVARVLLEHGVDVNARDRNRFTSLHLASKEGHTDVAQFLLEHGVDVNAWGNLRSTALHLASERGRLEVIRLLLEHGADVEAQDYRYRSPLQAVPWLDRRDEVAKVLSEYHILKSRNTL
jgi:ankyrin repeat protein